MDVSDGIVAHPLTCSLIPLTCSLAPCGSLHLRAPLQSLVRSLAHSLAPGIVEGVLNPCAMIEWLPETTMNVQPSQQLLNKILHLQFARRGKNIKEETLL